jgi:uncharacterized membrane protein
VLIGIDKGVITVNISTALVMKSRILVAVNKSERNWLSVTSNSHLQYKGFVMVQKEKRSVHYYLRALHRDVGFFVVGLVIIYSLSGIALVYRDTEFLTQNVEVEKRLAPGLDPSELSKTVRIKGFAVSRTEGDLIYFQGGTYNKATGLAVYNMKELPPVLRHFVGLHKTVSGKVTHWYAVLFGSLLCFMAISSFWMYPNSTSMLRRGLYIAVAGAAITTIVLFL